MRATFRNLYDEFNVAAFFRNRHDHTLSVMRWTLILVPMAAAIGTLCAAFLWSLEAATRARFDHSWLFYLPPVGGAAIALLSGLVGSASLLGAATFLALNLPPVADVASEATTAVAMHAVKLILYASALDLGLGIWPLAAGMTAAMIAGTWVGNRVIERLPAKHFRLIVAGLLAATAVKIIVTG